MVVSGTHGVVLKLISKSREQDDVSCKNVLSVSIFVSAAIAILLGP